MSKIENGADIPMNVQLVQMFQAQQAQAGMGDDMGMGEEGEEDWQNYGDEEEQTENEQLNDENSEVETEENEDFGEVQEEMTKSLMNNKKIKNKLFML